MNQVEQQLRLLVHFNVEFVVVGGVAATAHGSSYLTHDLDICYSRRKPNLERLAAAMMSVRATLRGAPRGLPFVCDAEALERGLNFTLDTDIGPVDLLGEVRGVGTYPEAIDGASSLILFGANVHVLSLSKLITAKRAAGRPKDLLVLPELEAIQEFRKKSGEEETSD